MSRFLPKIAICFVCLLVPLLGQTQEVDPAERLKAIRLKIERETRRLNDLQRRRKEITSSLERLEREFESARNTEDQTKQAIGKLDVRAGQLEVAVRNGREMIERGHKTFGERVRSIYKMHHRARNIHYLATATSATELLRRAGYLGRIAAADRRQLKKLQLALTDFEREKTELAQVKKEREGRLEDVIKLERSIEKKRVEQAALLDEAKREEQTKEETLAKLERSAKKLEAMMASIMGGEETPEEPRPVKVEPFKGQGLMKVSLPRPVEGEIIQRFGKQKHDEFADMLFVKGLEFRTAVGARARAVQQGKVIFAQVLPGYGNVVILDHGKRYYTLYGRLTSSLVRAGSVVEQGAELGILGEQDRKGRNFYFELRIRGKPVNPTGYFKP